MKNRKRKKLDWDRWVPAGMNGAATWSFLMAGLGAAIGISVAFFARYVAARSELYIHQGRELVLRSEAVMAPFHEVLGGSLGGFGIFALCMPFLALWHYAYHYQGGRSIYLMRRLPDKWELPRRCLALPVAALGLCVLLAAAVLLAYFAVYWLATPGQCLRPGQWGMLLRAWIYG